VSVGVLGRLKAGQVPLAVRQSAARGVLPVGQEELLGILIFLQSDPDPQVRKTASETLREEFNEDLIKRIVASDTTPVEVLEFFGRPPFHSRAVLEALIQNKITPDSTIALLADKVDADLINIMRLLRSPFILESLERNRLATPDITRRLGEIREEFFEKRNTFIPVHRTAAESREMAQMREDQEVDEESTALMVYSEEIKEGEDVTALTHQSLADDGFEEFDSMGGQERLSTIQRIARMTVAERVQTALKGAREERVILIRDANRLVASAVLDSPKLTDSEVDAFSLMKNVSEEVLRVLGTKREFMKNYSVIHNLVKNSRTPIGTSLPLLNRILTTDLKALTRNKNIPEVLRKSAQRHFELRTMVKQSK